MCARNPNRQPRLNSLRNTEPGWIRLATCTKCNRQGVLPIDALIRKHGELAMIELALFSLRCTGCGNRGASHSMVRLCDPGCLRRTVGGRLAAR